MNQDEYAVEVTDLTVAYDEKTADLHIDGRTRVSHGKGVVS